MQSRIVTILGGILMLMASSGSAKVNNLMDTSRPQDLQNSQHSQEQLEILEEAELSILEMFSSCINPHSKNNPNPNSNYAFLQSGIDKAVLDIKELINKVKKQDASEVGTQDALDLDQDIYCVKLPWTTSLLRQVLLKNDDEQDGDIAVITRKIFYIRRHFAILSWKMKELARSTLDLSKCDEAFNEGEQLFTSLDPDFTIGNIKDLLDLKKILMVHNAFRELFEIADMLNLGTNLDTKNKKILENTKDVRANLQDTHNNNPKYFRRHRIR
jgi:hypothetical protein